MNKRMKKKQSIRTITINNHLCVLMLMCQENELDFTIHQCVSGVFVTNPVGRTISSGYIENWDHATPAQELSRMIKEVQEYAQKNRP